MNNVSVTINKDQYILTKKDNYVIKGLIIPRPILDGILRRTNCTLHDFINALNNIKYEDKISPPPVTGKIYTIIIPDDK